jgi:hypothetical protein
MSLLPSLQTAFSFGLQRGLYMQELFEEYLILLLAM